MMRDLVVLIVLTLAAGTPAVAIAATGQPDVDNAGRLLRNVVPTGIPAASCPTVGPALAVVQASKLGITAQNPNAIALVTSCLSSRVTERAVLYFLNPGASAPRPTSSDSSAGAALKTLTTLKSGKAYAPGTGWTALASAPDKGVLLGCGNNGELYTIDYSVLTTTADGTLVAVGKPATATACTALAWDPANKSIYVSTGTTILHFFVDSSFALLAQPPGIPSSFSAPAGCTASGLNVAGGALMVACNGSTVMQRLDKTSGASLTSLQGPSSVAFQGGALADLECDSVTFSKLGVDAVWSKIVATNLLQAFRVPGGTCGLAPTATVFAPAACPTPKPGIVDNYRRDVVMDGGTVTVAAAPKDTDGDGLWDCWEDGSLYTATAQYVSPNGGGAPLSPQDGVPGIDFDGDGVRDVVLCAEEDGSAGFNVATECANPLLKDVFVEIDFMTGDATHPQGHRPDAQALANVKAAFAAAPVDAPNGIRVHFQVDEGVTHNSQLAFEPCTGPATATNGAADFDAVKTSFFGTAAERAKSNAVLAKRYGFHYMFFAHNLLNTSASGCAEVPGDDAVISLAGFPLGLTDPANPYYQRGSTDDQAGTVMHELGHNLGLRHGGQDNVNCKPNYLSVMNYSRQLPDYLPNRVLDYSRELLPTLNESALSETLGIGMLPGNASINGNKTVFSIPNTVTMKTQLLGTFCDPATGTCVDHGTAIDWNNNGSTGGTASSDVNKFLSAGCDGSGTVLASYNDWANLEYNARASVDFGAGARSSSPTEIQDKDAEQSQQSFFGADSDGDGTRDAFACGSTTVPCAIDIKPGSKPAVLSKGNNANVQVAIKATATFDPVSQVIRSSLTLNDVGVVQGGQNNTGTCSAVAANNGRQDLQCQFPAVALPVGGSNAVLEGLVCPSTGGCTTPTRMRAQDFIIVVK
jgi:hypothetical protein